MQKRGLTSSKKGLSDVVTNVLLILLVIVAIGIIWAFVYPMIAGAGKKAETSSLTTQLEIPRVYVNAPLQSVSLVVHRGTGEGSIEALKVVLESSSGASVVIRQDVSINESESKVLTVGYNGTAVSDVKKVSVIPIFMDSSGTETTGKVAASTIVSDDNIGKALKFDGNTVVSVPKDSSKNNNWIFSGDFAISYWVNFASYDTYLGTMSTAGGSSSQNGWWNEFGSARGFTMYSNTQAVYGLNDARFSSIPLGVWHYFAITRTGTTVNAYLDGQTLITGTFSGAVGTDMNPLVIGTYYIGAASRQLKGSLNDVRIYNRALTSADVSALYNSGMGDNLGSVSDGLIAWYKLDGDAKDSSGKGNDGTITGNPVFV